MEYRRCKNCVIDNSDSQIKFYANSIFDHCNEFNNSFLPNQSPNKKGEDLLIKEVKKIISLRYDKILLSNNPIQNINIIKEISNAKGSQSIFVAQNYKINFITKKYNIKH